MTDAYSLAALNREVECELRGLEIPPYPDPSGEAVEHRVRDAIERMVSFEARNAQLQEREEQVSAERESARTDLLINLTWTAALMTWTVYLLTGAVGLIVGLFLAAWFIERYWDRISTFFGRNQ